MDGQDQARARISLAQRLESLQRAGVLQIGKVPAPQAKEVAAAAGLPPAAVRTTTPAPPTAVPSAPQEAPMPRAKTAALPLNLPSGPSIITRPYPAGLPDDAPSRQRLMDELNAQVKACKLCTLSPAR